MKIVLFVLPVEFHQYSQATSLAEKYQDFGILTQLCEDRHDKEAIERYSLQFKDQVHTWIEKHFHY